MQGLSDSSAITMQPLKKSYEIAGKKISFETGKIGLLTNGAITMSDEGGNMLFTTAGIKEV
jgi:polyribonucleotide nucleotidyltransferase